MWKHKWSKRFMVLAAVLLVVLAMAIGYVVAEENDQGPDENSIRREIESKVKSNHHIPLQIQESSGDLALEAELNDLKSKAQQNRTKRLHQADQYNYTQSELEDLLVNGATVEDIYYSDYIGNEWLVEPKELIKQKQDGSLSWTEIEAKVKRDKESQLALLSKKHPKVQNLFAKKKMNSAEKLQMLELADQQGEQAVSKALVDYESKGLEGLHLKKSDSLEEN
ncbi:hypothetical protein [Cohnella sp. AR92]|uniref:hypothetical protein n=1 Tax=Cohnella sp. AR92 TaxID=648716 RepID=UPI000F8F452A|nr:hypothetical protein [Cohnella sp. AR92]RUS43550.1 hypothetical protein ELR57_24790 [Cohnella sp. AR92]